MQLFGEVPNIDFMSKRKVCLLASLILVLIGSLSLAYKGGPDLGVEFTGGVLIELRFKEAPQLGRIRSALAGLGMADSQVQQFGEREEVLLRLRPKGDVGRIDQAVTGSLEREFAKGSFEIRRVEAIGPAVSQDLMKKALYAVSFALVAILVYIGFRFRFVWGLAGVVALLHDLLITIGIFSLAGREWSLPVVAAFLTIAGYSINDTIVVFGRVRENVRLKSRDPLESIINVSINQTLSRTFITSGTTLMVTLALFWWGGEVLKDFALALIIGVFVGTYSSVFVAAPIVVTWYRKR
jgi:preprotein translocase subunit SecF